jgi:hypothetical protein
MANTVQILDQASNVVATFSGSTALVDASNSPSLAQHDTILASAGQYTGDIHINLSDVHLVGQPGAVINGDGTGFQGAVNFAPNLSGGSLSGFTVNGSPNDVAVVFVGSGDSNISIDHNVLNGVSGNFNVLLTDQPGPVQNLTIDANTFGGTAETAIFVQSNLIALQSDPMHLYRL